MNSRILLGLTALTMIGASSLALAQDYGDTELAMNSKAPFGQYLTDGAGRSLYMFEQDKRGQSNCYDACAQVWPPFVANANAIEAEDLDRNLIGTVERRDGQMQVTYDGRPLYYYIKDKGQPGSTKGHDVHDQFGAWYLVAPTGNEVGLGAAYVAPAAAEPVAPCVKTNVKNFKNACPQ